MDYFRFENLDIWKYAIELSDSLFDYPDRAEDRKFFRFAEQHRAATLSISNNMTEGSGSFSNKEFACFLNIARRSVFKCANILNIFLRRKIISEVEKNHIYPVLILLSKRITSFHKSLNKTL